MLITVLTGTVPGKLLHLQESSKITCYSVLYGSNKTTKLRFFIFAGRIRIRDAQKLTYPAPEHYNTIGIKTIFHSSNREPNAKIYINQYKESFSSLKKVSTSSKKVSGQVKKKI